MLNPSGIRTSWLAVAVTACGGTDALTNCPEAQPSIDECYVGAFFADCGGGEGPPRFACGDRGCMWFTGDCGPAGYHASDCSADNLCCENGWPFPDHEHADVIGVRLTSYSGMPWDRRTAAALDVIVDPTLAGTATSFTCAGPDPYGYGYSPCREPEATTASAFQQTTATIWAGTWNNRRAGWSAWVEIVEIDGVHRARMCASPMTDLSGQCDPRPLLCASAGTITVNQYPIVDVLTLVVDIDADFPTGFTVDATLVPGT